MSHILHTNIIRVTAIPIIALAVSVTGATAETPSRWEISALNSITWNITPDRIPHYDHIEMSGEKMSAVLRYGVNSDGSFSMGRSIVWPMLRTVPNNTHASLTKRFGIDFIKQVMVEGNPLINERVKSLTLNGQLTVVSEFSQGAAPGGTDGTVSRDIEITRVYSPSTTLPAICEQYTIKNNFPHEIEVIIPAQRTVYTTAENSGVKGSYTLVAKTDNTTSRVTRLKPGESVTFGASIQGFDRDEKELSPDIAAELAARDRFTSEVQHKLRFESPDETINTAFAFAKVRASESIFRTKGGLMHGPGGEAYYAAIWCNDQAEYVNPFFPFLGYEKGNESAMNAYRHFAAYMNDGYKRAIPSSVIAEGDSYWCGAGDRGDGAMIAYGAARTALQLGDPQKARELWPLIKWCLEFSRRKTNDKGVVASDSDELEGRFPSGEANLCTSTLHYDALLSAACLADEFGEKSEASQYRKEAADLRRNIGRYFEANVEGFDTYRYYDGNTRLRSWICMPLVTGIFDRKDGTIAALLSPKLMTENGCLTQSGDNTFWDRSTLYALRGIFAAGEHEKAIGFLRHYSATRLLGEHVPYPVEAWPEGSQRHLSAESGLYCRIITEGIFGFRPTGFRSFRLTPQLPDEWDHMALRDIHAFGNTPFDVTVTRQGEKLTVTIESDGKVIHLRKIAPGKTIDVTLPKNLHLSHK